MDQKKGNLYWVSCKQNTIGTTVVNGQYSRELYSTTKEVRDLCLDWLRETLMWLEDNRIVVMSMMGGQAKELQQLAGGVVGHMAFDPKAHSLLWNSKLAGWLAFLIGNCCSNGQNQLFVYICSLQSQCTVCIFRILYRFDNFEFVEREKPPRW